MILFPQRRSLLSKLNSIEFVNPEVALSNYVSDTLTRNGFKFDIENEAYKNIFDTKIKQQLKKLIRTLVYFNVDLGVVYITIDKMKNNDLVLNIINPAFPIQITKANGIIVEADVTISEGGKTLGNINYTKRKYTKNINYTTIKNSTIEADPELSLWDKDVHNLGFCPVIEVPLKPMYRFTTSQLNCIYQPYKWMENQGSLEYNEVLFQDTFVPLKASAPYMSELIKESYKQFYRNMLKTNPRFIMTGTSAKIQNQLNDKSKNSLDNLLDSDTFITLKGDTTKADVLNPQVDLANFLKTIGMLIDQWYAIMGLNSDYDTSGNNKTQTEVETEDELNKSTFGQIILALESSMEELIDKMFFWYSKILTEGTFNDYELNDERVRFMFKLNNYKKQCSAQAIDSMTKLLQAQIYTNPMVLAEIKGWSLEDAKKFIEENKKDYDELAEQNNPEPQLQGGADKGEQVNAK